MLPGSLMLTMFGKTGLLQHKNKKLLILCPAAMVNAAACLERTYKQAGIDTIVVEYSGRPPETTFYEHLQLKNINAVLVIGKMIYAPATVLPGPFIFIKKKKIPAAWLPVKSENDITEFASVVKTVHERKQNAIGVALLAQWHPRYLKITNRMDELLNNSLPVFKWTGDVVGREDVVKALGSGLGIGLYFGHGRPIGWVGYYGIRSGHFKHFQGSPLGCMLSFCCKTASRKRTGLSYSEALPLMGVAAASFGAVKETKHSDNTKWAIGICNALREGVNNLGDLLLKSEPIDAGAVQHYRIIGDPLAPLYTDVNCIENAASVPVYN